MEGKEPRMRSCMGGLRRADDASASEGAGVIYRSRGSLLIVGEASVAPVYARALSRLLRVVVLADGPPQAGDGAQGVTVVPGRLSALSGHLGAFRASAAGRSAPVDLGPLAGNRDGCFDLILDLIDPPALPQVVAPPGYYAPRGDQEALNRALQELPTLLGTFVKPYYFELSAARCGHRRRGVQACVRCIEVCPAQAIGAGDEAIRVDAYRCWGCGECAAVCPTGAIRHTSQPSLTPILQAVRGRAIASVSTGAPAPAVVFYDVGHPARANAGFEADLPEGVLAFATPALGAVGMAHWMAALAAGARAVWLVAERRTWSFDSPPSPQLEMARAILGGLGLPADCLRLLARADWPAMQQVLAAIRVEEPIASADLPGTDDRRELVFAALDALSQGAPGPLPHWIDLPPGAPFGQVGVDTEACTLCAACVTVCPTGALSQGERTDPVGAQELRFVEHRCIQCGGCVGACPESAIQMLPRFVYDRHARAEVRAIQTAEAFPCIRCGRPFSTRAMVQRVSERLEAHPAFRGEGLRYLRMCEGCRAQEAAGESTMEIFPLP